MATTRRRGEALEKAILEAGWQQLTEKAYSGFTFEAIAERARTSKAVLYRRWPDKESLLLAVLAHHGIGTAYPVPDTGSLREDVLALLRPANRLGDSIAALLSTVAGAYFDGTLTSLGRLRQQLLGAGSDAMTDIVQRAVDRGEIPAMPSARIVGLPTDLLRVQAMMTFTSATEETLVDIVDTVFLPLARGAQAGSASPDEG